MKNVDTDSVLKEVMPLLTFFALPLILWPSLVMVVALILQARGAYLLKPKHIAILVTVQFVWLLIVGIAFSSFSILKPFRLL